MGILEGIIAFIKAIPIVDKWVQQFIAFYVNSQIDKMAQENRDAIKKAVERFDQRDLERAIGNPHAGGVAPVPDTVIVDHIDGVP